MFMQQRSIAICIVLSIITCGLYALYWMAQLNDSVSILSNRQGTTGGMVVVFSIITCGLYSLYWYYQMGTAVESLHAYYNEPNGSSQIVYLVLGIFGLGIVSMALMQSEVNKYLGSNGGY